MLMKLDRLLVTTPSILILGLSADVIPHLTSTFLLQTYLQVHAISAPNPSLRYPACAFRYVHDGRYLKAVV